MLTPVALVPYPSGLVPMRELLQVTAALQTQVNRDLNRIWNVTGSVSAFEALEDLPPGYIPLVIVKTLPGKEHGFHLAATGQPISLVEYGDAWALRASHELIEILCDPWGTRTAQGPSLQADQGQVEYLVEVCDPCQHATYSVDGVELSDFVTPDYYDPFKVSGRHYSFTGLIEEPRQLLDGGYVSWRTLPPGDRVFQAFAPPARRRVPRPARRQDLKINSSDGVATAFTRTWVDSNPTKGLPRIKARTAGRSRANGPYYAPARASDVYGKAIGVEVNRIIATLEGEPPTVGVEDIIKLLRQLADPDNRTFRKRFAEDPGPILAEFKIPTPIGLLPPKKRPTAAHYRTVLEALLENHRRFTPYFGDPDVASWLSTLGTLGTLGTTLGIDA